MNFWAGWIIFYLFRNCFGYNAHTHSHTLAHKNHFDITKCLTCRNGFAYCMCCRSHRVASHHHQQQQQHYRHWTFHFTLYKWISSFIWMETVNVLLRLLDESLQSPTTTIMTTLSKTKTETNQSTDAHIFRMKQSPIKLIREVVSDACRTRFCHRLHVFL